MRKTVAVLLILAITVIVIPSLTKTSAQYQWSDFKYGGEIYPEFSATFPSFIFKLENGSSINTSQYNASSILIEEDLGQRMSFNITASAGNAHNSFDLTLLNVSYTVSWLSKPVAIYNWQHNPANISDWDNNNKTSLNYNLTLTDIPIGQQDIQFTIFSGGIYVNPTFGYFNTFTMESNATLNLIVEPKITNPSPTVPEFSILPIIPLLIAILTTAIMIREEANK
jgi:hypothetical protein